ncbi:hypothetical protein D3C81_1916780 [compost metagenome]
MIAEDPDRGMKLPRQALRVHRQFAQPHLNVGGFVDGGDLGELQGTEQQVIGIGGDVLHLQLVEVRQVGQLRLDVVLGGGQEGQRVAQ